MADAFGLLSGLVLDDGRRWGDAAERWQCDDARAVLRGEPRRHFQVRPRGASKTTDAAAVALAALVTQAPPRSRSYVYGVDEGNAAELLDALNGFVARTEGLTGAVKVGASTVTVPATGATLSIEASDAASAWNKKPWLIVVDELTSWPQTRNHRTLWGAIVSALPKRQDSRLLVLSMAGAPTHFAAKIWRHAESSADWRASHLPGPCPWWSPADVEAARADLEIVTEGEFRRVILAEWTGADADLATEEAVLACVRSGAPAVLACQPGVVYRAGLDVGTRRDATALCVGHNEQRQAGRTAVVDRLVTWTPQRGQRVDLEGQVQPTVLRLCREYRARLRFDRTQAEQLTQNVEREGVSVVDYPLTQAGANRLAKTLYVALRDRAVEIPDDRELIHELQTVQLVETGPGTVKLVNPPGTHDDRAVALGMVLVDLAETTGGPGRVRRPTRRVPQLGLGTWEGPKRGDRLNVGRHGRIPDVARRRP